MRGSSTNFTENQNKVQNTLPSLTNHFSNTDEWTIIPTTNINQPSPQNDNEPKRKFSPSNSISKTKHLNSPSLVAKVDKVSNKFSQENKNKGGRGRGKKKKKS